MTHPEPPKHQVQLERFTVLAPRPPFIDVILQCCQINPQEYSKIMELVESYPNDPRLIETVRKAGDASAKVPYLIDYGETPQTILEALREVAAPHIENLKKLPEPMRATIHSLLSLNIVPHGYEAYGIPALLEIGQMQREITKTLRSIMEGRKLAQETYEDNKKALHYLDHEWPDMRKSFMAKPFYKSLPERSEMQFFPVFNRENLVAVYEVCVIVDLPNERELRNLTPRVLQKPLPEHETAPETGSADWLLRMVGKVGRHFTRALLDIIGKHLESEQIHFNSKDYDRVNYEAQDAFRAFIESHP